MEGGSGEYSYTLTVPTSIEETEGGVVTKTEYEWNEDGSIKARKQTRDGQSVYEDSDYTYDMGTITYNRSYYEGGSVSSVVRVEEKYLYTNWTGLYSTKIYNGETLIEREENLYTNGFQSGYEHEKQGVMLLSRTDYKYDSVSITYIESGSTVEGRQSVKTTFLFIEYGMLNDVLTLPDEVVVTVEGEPESVISRKKYSYSELGASQGYKLYKGDTEQVIEEQTDNVNETDKASYTTKWYDNDGEVTRSVSTVKNTKTLTIKVKY
jgi:hypothetical protein